MSLHNHSKNGATDHTKEGMKFHSVIAFFKINLTLGKVLLGLVSIRKEAIYINRSQRACLTSIDTDAFTMQMNKPSVPLTPALGIKNSKISLTFYPNSSIKMCLHYATSSRAKALV